MVTPVGPDQPPPDEPFTVDQMLHRWPSGTATCELVHGALLFTPVHAFDERDVETAQRTYPGRMVELLDGTLMVWPQKGRTIEI